MYKKALFFLFVYISTSAQIVKTDHAEAELISETKNVVPGQPFTVALHISHEDEWHTYWRNAGDAGIPTKLEWSLPEGFTAGEIQWPYPHKIIIADVANYGYENDLYLLTDIYPPADLKPGTEITIKLKATWLICRIECLPGGAELELTLPVGKTTEINDVYAGKFNSTREKLPLVNHDWKVFLEGRSDTSINIELIRPDWISYDPESIKFFPYSGGYIKNSADQKFVKSGKDYGSELLLEDFIVEEPDTLKGILVSESGWRGLGSEKAIEVQIPLNVDNKREAVESGSDSSILLALIFAFAGGIILNLMPCVLPVLSIKILGFARQAGQDSSKILKHGLFFTIGVVVSFLALAALLIILREGGEQLGWGFQLQSPLFLIVLSVLLMVFSLSLFGVFEIGTSAANFGGRIENRGGNFGAVLS